MLSKRVSVLTRVPDLPALAVGLGLGVRVYGRIDQRSFGRVLIAAMLCGGIAYILDSVRKLVSSA